MTDEAKPETVKKPRKKSCLKILVANDDGTIGYATAQPPSDMGAEREVIKWMSGGRVDAGKYLIVRELASVQIEAVPQTVFKMKVK